MVPGLYLLPRQSQLGCRPTPPSGGWCRVFCSPFRLFHRDTKPTSINRDLVPSGQFYHDTKPSSTYRDWQKKPHCDPPTGGTPTHKKEFGSRHRDTQCCCQKHIFLPIQNFLVRQLVGSRK